MTNEEFLSRLKLIIDSPVLFPGLLDHAKKLVEIYDYARALKGDLDAHDESPNHFASYINLTIALKNLERE